VTEVLLFLVLAVVGFLFAGVLSPFEALGWWAGWYGREASEALEDEAQTPNAHAKHFVVFLSGINSVSGEAFAEREIAFLKRLKEELKDTVVVDDLFPYSVTEQPLTGGRVFAKFWRWALRQKLNGPALAGFLINLRNLWQVAVSADSRYGPIYNQSSATMILNGLKRHGYAPKSGVPVTLIGYSGGAQIAVGAAPYLKEIIPAPITVISLGGVISADPGLLTLEHVYHLYGQRDMVQRLGSIFFPGRWPFLPSPWNRAKAKGIVKLVPMGRADHTGPGGYLDEARVVVDGRSYLDVTVETITALVRQEQQTLAQASPALEGLGAGD